MDDKLRLVRVNLLKGLSTLDNSPDLLTLGGLINYVNNQNDLKTIEKEGIIDDEVIEKELRELVRIDVIGMMINRDGKCQFKIK